MTLPPENNFSSEENAVPSSDDKTFVAIAIFGDLFAAVIPALVVYLMKKDSHWVRQESAKVLNFNFTLLIILIGSTVLLVPALFIDNGPLVGITFCVLWIVWAALIISHFIFLIVNGVRAMNNQETKYWPCFPMVKP